MHKLWSTTIQSVLLFADVVLLLLRDECSDIRETMSKFVQWMESEYKSSKPAVLPSLAEEQFIEWLDKQFRLLTIDKPWTVWLQLIGKQLDRRTTENEDVIDEVFDRSEANVFGEVVLVGKKLMGKVQQNLTESGLGAKDVEDILRSTESNWPELFSDGGLFLRF